MTSRISWEVDCKRRLRPQLRPFLALARLARSLAERALHLRAESATDQAPLDRPSRVQLQILVQASNQLRIIELAAERGFALQAFGSAATLYELVSALAYIRGDAAKAAQWFAHTDSRHTFPPTTERKTGIGFMLAATGTPAREIEAGVRAWEDLHKKFCVAKHGNPVLLRKYGVGADGKQLKLHIGPISGGFSDVLARRGLYHGAQLVADASFLAAIPLLGSKQVAVQRFKRAWRRIRDRFKKLTPEQAEQRWRLVLPASLR